MQQKRGDQVNSLSYMEQALLEAEKALLNDEIASITGQEIIVDGGISVNGSFGL